MDDIPSFYLQARKLALEELEERLGEVEFDIAVRAIDLYIDFIESYDP